MFSAKSTRRAACALAFASACVCATTSTADALSAQAVVKETTEQLLDSINREREQIDSDKARLYEIVEQIVVPRFDFSRMARRVLGRHWRDATPEQRERFTKTFQQMLVRTYATAVAEYRDQAIVYLPVRERGDGGEVSVRTQVEPPGGAPIPIFYEMYPIDDQWKVYDVSIGGVSLVINYRSSFSSEIRQNGMDSLIDRIAEMNRLAIQ